MKGISFDQFKQVVRRHFDRIMEEVGAVPAGEYHDEFYRFRYRNALVVVDVILVWDGFFVVDMIRLLDGKLPGEDLLHIDPRVHKGPFTCAVHIVAEFHGEEEDARAHQMISGPDDFEESVRRNALWVEQYCTGILQGQFSDLEAVIEWLNDRRKRKAP